MGIIILKTKKTNINNDTSRTLSNGIKYNAPNSETLNKEPSNKSSPATTLGDLVKSYNNIGAQRQTQLNNMLKMVPNTIQILLNSNYQKQLYNIYLETQLLVKLRYEQYNLMDQQFNSIDEIIIKIEKQIQYNIRDLISLSKADLSILIDTIRICELEDTNNIKTLYHSCNDWAEWRKSNHDIDMKQEEKEANIMGHNSMKDKVKSEIEAFILKSIETIYKENEIKKCLSEIDEMIIDLKYIENKMNDIFPKHYDIINYFNETYFQFCKGLLPMKLDNNKIETQNKLFVMTWIDLFKQSILNINVCHTCVITAIINEAYDSILHSYINEMTNKSKKWVSNIMQNVVEHFVVNNIPRIHSVQSLLTLFNKQVNIIMKYIGKLRGDTFVKLVNEILKSMDKFSDLLLDYIQKHMCASGAFKDEYVCALLNSSYDVSVKLIIQMENILKDKFYNDESLKTEIENSFDKRVSKFTNISKICAIKMGGKIVKYNIKVAECFEIQNVICDHGFIEAKASILNNDCNVMKTSIEEEYFFNEMIKSVINSITNEYIESISKLNKMNAKQISNGIKMDMKFLDNFFKNFDNSIQIYWSEKSKIFNALFGAFTCETGFFKGYAQSLMDNGFDDKLIKFIKNKRRMQLLINKTSLLKLKVGKSFKRKGNNS